jgi:hypothetical protein
MGAERMTVYKTHSDIVGVMKQFAFCWALRVKYHLFISREAGGGMKPDAIACVV